jgi:hypothetical protein
MFCVFPVRGNNLQFADLTLGVRRIIKDELKPVILRKSPDFR